MEKDIKTFWKEVVLNDSTKRFKVKVSLDGGSMRFPPEEFFNLVEAYEEWKVEFLSDEMIKKASKNVSSRMENFVKSKGHTPDTDMLDVLEIGYCLGSKAVRNCIYGKE